MPQLDSTFPFCLLNIQPDVYFTGSDPYGILKFNTIRLCRKIFPLCHFHFIVITNSRGGANKRQLRPISEKYFYGICLRCFLPQKVSFLPLRFPVIASVPRAPKFVNRSLLTLRIFCDIYGWDYSLLKIIVFQLCANIFQHRSESELRFQFPSVIFVIK